MTTTAKLRIRFWGVRGSYPAPGPATARVGGNSSCVSVETDDHLLIFDAGTGIVGLGQDLVRHDTHHALHLFFSHTHHDHLEGLRFFLPVYRSAWKCRMYARATLSIERLLTRLMQPDLFPVGLSELPAQISFKNLADLAHIRLRGRHPIDIAARYCSAHAKAGVMLYRITCGGRSLVYATDVEAPKGAREDVIDFARGADILIHDAQYTEEEYYGVDGKAGWGHSTVRMAAEAARDAGVGQLILYHHDPNHDDRQVARLERAARKIFPNSRTAIEGLELHLPERPLVPAKPPHPRSG